MKDIKVLQLHAYVVKEYIVYHLEATKAAKRRYTVPETTKN